MTAADKRKALNACRQTLEELFVARNHLSATMDRLPLVNGPGQRMAMVRQYLDRVRLAAERVHLAANAAYAAHRRLEREQNVV